MEEKPSTPSSSFTDASRHPRRLPHHPVLPAFQGQKKDSAQSVLRESTKQLQGMLPAVAAKPTHFQESRGQQHAGSVPKTRIRLWAVRTARAMLGSGGSLHYRTCTPRTCKRARRVSQASTVSERSKMRRQKRRPPTPIHVPTARRAHIQGLLVLQQNQAVPLVLSVQRH